MKSIHLIGALALALALSLAACGGEPSAKHADDHADDHANEQATEAHGHEGEGDAHGEQTEHGGQGDGHEFERTEIPAEVAQESGIEVAPVGPGTIADEHEVQGLLTPVEGKVASGTARFPGVIRALRANVGDTVKAGQPLASIESNLSLSTYTVNAPISGVVTARNASVGGVAGEGTPLFEIADLSKLWVDLHIFGADAQHIRAGVPVTITRMGDGKTVQATIERVLPGMATASQSTIARATIDNADGLWRPGSAVRARITVEQQPADLVVPLSALQTMDGGDVVFVRVGDTYQAKPVEIGARDADAVEILDGVRKGEQVVVEQSYLIKADIEKEGASHDH